MSQAAIDALERVSEHERNYVANYFLGSAYESLAKALGKKGLSTEGAYRCATTYFGRAIELDPERLSAYNGLAQCNYNLANQLPLSQAMPLLRESRDGLTRAVEINPKHSVIRYQLGRVLLRLAEGGRLGADYLDDALCEQALVQFQEAVTLNPKQGLFYERISWAWILRAQNAYNHGQPYEAFFDNAVSVCEQGLERHPNAGYLQRNLGMSWYFRAKFQLRAGKDPRLALQRAQAYARDAVEGTKAVENYSLLGNIGRLRAEWAFVRGGDPQPYFDEAEEAFGKLSAMGEVFDELYYSVTNLNVLKARWQAKQGLDWTASLNVARRALAQAGFNGDQPQALLARTGFHLLNPRPVLAEIHPLMEALEARDDLPELLAAKACLTARLQGAMQARPLLARAVELNPNLGFFWEPLFAEVSGQGFVR
jgi:tetratricopeptide (TPR) repeat protein